MRPYTPPSAADLPNPNQSAISHWSWGFITVRGGIDPGEELFRRLFVEVLTCGGLCDPGMRPYTPRSVAGLTNPNQSAIGHWRWVFITVPGGIDPVDYHFRPRSLKL